MSNVAEPPALPSAAALPSPTWRFLRPTEIDHEIVWLGVSIAALGGAWVWLHTGMPLPQCVFHTVTGLPCVACGSTRCVRFAFQGNFPAALRMNPLAFCGLVGTLIFDLYAAAVLAFRLPRWRPRVLQAPLGRKARAGLIAVILANWAWLIWSGV